MHQILSGRGLLLGGGVLPKLDGARARKFGTGALRADSVTEEASVPEVNSEAGSEGGSSGIRLGCLCKVRMRFGIAALISSSRADKA